MRRRFNEGKFWERMKNGEFRAILLEECKPQREIAEKEPLGPDGTVAAWGLPDPKRLFENGVLYILEKKQKVQS